MPDPRVPLHLCARARRERKINVYERLSRRDKSYRFYFGKGNYIFYTPLHVVAGKCNVPREYKGRPGNARGTALFLLLEK